MNPQELPGPGSADPNPTDHVDRAMAAVATAVRTCVEMQAELEASFKGFLNDCHTACATSLVDCQACVIGRVYSAIEGAATSSQACRAALEGRVIALTGRAMSAANAAVGYTTPTVEQANANLEMDVYPTVGPLAVNPPLPPVQVLPGLDFGVPPPPPVILPQPMPFPTLGEPPPPPQIGPPDVFPAPGMGGGQCPPPVINVPPCPAPAPPQIFIMPPIGGGGGGPLPPVGFDGNGNPIFPTYPPPTEPPVVILPPTEPPPEPPPVNVYVTVPPPPPVPAPPPQLGGTGPRKPVTDPASGWNKLDCGATAAGNLADFDGNWFRWLEKKSGLFPVENANGSTDYAGPEGFFKTDTYHKLSTAELARWYAAYTFSVVLPGLGATLVPPSGSCNLQLSIGNYALLLIVEFVERWVGVDLTNLKQPSKYDINYNCPSFLPGQGQVDDLYRKELINDDLWYCWTRANNNLDKPAAAVRDANRPRLSHAEAWRIGNLNPKDWPNAWVEALRFEGYSQKYAPALYDLQWDVPGYAQIQTWVQYSVDDMAVVNRYGLETGFNDLWNDEFSKYLQANGTRQVNAERQWRAHWSHVSSAAAQRMQWRSRDDSPTWPAGVEKVTSDDVNFLRDLEGVAPFWRDKLTALARPIPQKRELLQMLQYGVIDRIQYKAFLLDYGYTDKNADLVVARAEAVIAKQRDRTDNAITQGQIIGMYVAGQITLKEFKDEMTARGVESETVDRMVPQVEFRRTVRVRTVARRAIKLQFTTGGITSDVAVNQLIATGMQPDEALKTLQTWTQHVKTQGKQVATATLCKWVGQGLMSGGEYFDRLIAIGWAASDAKKIVESCGLDWTKKNQAKFAKTVKSRKVTTTQTLAPVPTAPKTVETDTVSETDPATYGG